MVLAAAAILIAAVIAAVILTLPKQSEAERLEEALSLGEKYLSELNYEQAIASYQAAIAIDPKCADAYLGLADAYIAMGDYEEAAKVLAQAEKMLRNRQEAGEDVSADLERIRGKMAELEALIREKQEEAEALERKRQEEAEALLKQQREQEAAQKLSLAEQYLFASEYDDAIREFVELLEMTPDRLTAYFGGVDAYLHLAQNAAAAALVENGSRVIENGNFAKILEGVNKSTIEGYISLAEAFEAEGLHERALELLERVYRETGDEIIGRKLGIVEASRIEFREDYVIEWKDAEFERLIREYLGKETGDIHYDEVKEIEEINIWAEIIAKPGEDLHWSCSSDKFWLGDGREGTASGKIRTLEDLEHFTSLKRLMVNFQEDMDISALADTDTIDCLLRLESLTLINDELNDISVVSGLSALKSINIAMNNITDISPLAMLIELTSVEISDNEQLTSAEPLKGLRKLAFIGLGYIDTVDLELFSDLPELRNMQLFGIREIDYSVLQKMELDYLEIDCNDEIFSIIRQLKTLKSLRLHGSWNGDGKSQSSNGFTSIEGIGELTNLMNLDLLIYNCHDISPISSLNIETLEIDWLSEDCDLSPLKALTNLKTIIVPVSHHAPEDDTGSRLFERVKDLLPDVEVKDSRY